MDKYQLITTDLGDTLLDNRIVLFLGAWCVRKGNPKNNKNQKEVFVEPIFSDSNERAKAFEYLIEIRKRFCVDLYEQLNVMHDESHTYSYWDIIAGHWAKRYISTMYNRYYSIKSIVHKYSDIKTCVMRDVDPYYLCSSTSMEFYEFVNSSIWNHVLYSLVIKEFHEIQVKYDDSLCNYPLMCSTRKRLTHRIILRRILNSIYLVTRRQTDAIIVNSYLPRFQELALFLRMLQIPTIWNNEYNCDNDVQSVYRDKLLLEGGGCDDFEVFIRRCAKYMIPKIYLEGYKSAKKYIESLCLPIRPKLVYTSNNYDSDDLFKIMCAGYKEKDVPILFGQHGAGYGTHLYFKNKYSPECIHSDYFISWGSISSNTKAIPMFTFKTLKKKISARKKSNIILISPSMLNNITHWDNWDDYIKNFEYQLAFVKALEDNVRKRLFIKMHVDSKRNKISEKDIWLENIPQIHICDHNKTMDYYLKRSSIAVFAYDSTGLLECISMGYPCIGFWYGGFSHLNTEAKKDYEMLVSVGIIHLSPQNAAEHINQYIDNYDLWWNDDVVVNARHIFCSKYARSSGSVKMLADVLKKISKKKAV